MSRANASHFSFMHHIIASFCIHVIKHGLNNRNVLNIGDIRIIERKLKIPHQYNTQSKAKKMAEESDARIERLEKESQELRAKMAEMMKLIRTLIRDKG